MLGDNSSGQLGDTTKTTRYRPVMISVGATSGPLAAITSIASHGHHSCALLADTTVACWGEGGALGDGTTANRARPVVVRNATDTGPLTGVAQVVVGSSHTCARLTSGAEMCWGENSFGQLGDGTTGRAPPACHREGRCRRACGSRRHRRR